jgi:uncharacterized protein (DUF1697 family)
LLRGINVGGNNIIKMDTLRKLFEDMGFECVKTYIQSGNVIFSDCEGDRARLTEKIEKMLSKHLASVVKAAVLTLSEMRWIIDKKPECFGEKNDEYKYNVLFFIKPLKAKDAIKEIKAREGVDEIYEGKDVVYSSCLISRRTKSYLSKIVETTIYKNTTIRNWNTTKKLYELMGKDSKQEGSDFSAKI